MGGYTGGEENTWAEVSTKKKGNRSQRNYLQRGSQKAALKKTFEGKKKEQMKKRIRR